MNAPRPRRILVVDRHPRNLQLLLEALNGDGYQTLVAPDLAQFDALIAEPGSIALALVDMDGFDPRIWERCRRLHDCRVEVLVMVKPCSIRLVQIDCVRCGARAVLPKPLSRRQLMQLVRGLVEESA